MSKNDEGVVTTVDELNQERVIDLSNSKSDFNVDIEKVGSNKGAIDSDDTDSIFGQDRHRLAQTLEQRHIQMIALVGVFGTGIFLSSGSVLYTAGPLGCFLAYLLIGVLVGFNQIALAEVAALLPVTSATIRHLDYFVDEAFGFGFGWMCVWGNILPGEISSCAVLVQYWTDLNPAIFISVFIVGIIAANSYSIRFYAEFEFVFAIIKLLLLVGLIIFSIVITSGGGPSGEKIGFKYWKEGVFNYDYLNLSPKSSAGFVGFYKALSSVVYSYGGVQSVPNLAAEVKNPRRAIFTACKRIFIRVTILMCTVAFLLTLIVSSKDESIASGSGDATNSPFVIAATNANIKVIPHIINGVVLTSAFSVSNMALVSGSRTLFALAVKGQAPKIFLKTNKRGLPYVGMAVVIAFMPLAYMSVSSSAATVFGWFQNLTSTNILVTWVCISINHIRMTAALKAQGYPKSRLPYTIRFSTFSAWISGIAAFIFLITTGFVNFIDGQFSASSFIGSYITITIITILTLFWKFYKKTRLLRADEIDLESLFRDVDENPEPPAEPLRGWRILTLLWS